MNDKFDQLTRNLAQTVNRRQALQHFGACLAGLVLACFAVARKAEAGTCKAGGAKCLSNSECCSGYCYNPPFSGKNNGSKFGTCSY